MPEGKSWFPSNAETPAAVTIPPSQVVGSTIIVFTPSLPACNPADTPLAPPPITNTSVSIF